VEVVSEHGVAGASVELVIARAGMSHRTFYERFAGLDECLVAIMDGAQAHVGALLSRSFEREGSWLDGMRSALAAMLQFFDSDPVLARVCLVEMMGGGPVVREHRERVFEAVRLLLVERIEVEEVSHVSPLVKEGVLASVTGIINARLIVSERAERVPLVELLGPLMGIIVEPFMEEALIAREIERGNELAQELLAGHREEGPPGPVRPGRSAGVLPALALDPDPAREAVQDARAGVVGRLRARQVEIEEVIFAHVRDADKFGPAGGDDAEYVAGLRASVTAALDYALVGIEQGEEWSGPIPSVAMEQARRAARNGVGLDAVLRRYAAGRRLMSDFIMTEAEGFSTQALRRVLDLQGLLAERLMVAVSTEYKQEAERAGRSPERRQLELVRSLLAGERLDGVQLDYDLDGEHVGVIARGAGAREALRSLAGRLDRRMLCVDSGEGTVWAWFGGNERFVMADVERVLVSAAAGEGVVLATGEPARGLEGWRLTHQQAQAALVVALRRPRRYTRYADVALLATALKDELLAAALIDVYIAPLEDSRGGGPVLCETLRAYLNAECNVSSAAAALGVVRKTVENRLRTIEERLGRTLHPCPAELEVALLLDELSAVSK
jgi:AcrR family transcriptional regulator